MDVAPPNQHPATSDDELAKVLAGIGANNSASPQGTSPAEAAGLQFEETPGPIPATGAGQSNVNSPVAPPPMPDVTAPVVPPIPQPIVPVAPMPSPLSPIGAPTTGGLDSLKKNALEELRPLVGKLDLPPEERFDTLLLIIRSTDDQSLLEPAHEAAKAITDDTKRAQALLDIIKEIDYFSQGPQQPVTA